MLTAGVYRVYRQGFSETRRPASAKRSAGPVPPEPPGLRGGVSPSPHHLRYTMSVNPIPLYPSLYPSNRKQEQKEQIPAKHGYE